ncbi:MAG: hypothetical protein K9M80_03265 [Candidatus Marinimicrobia bacterium]|nr:hypothetical protein [Candidatus Neomarinimicrobiota bacterium]
MLRTIIYIVILYFIGKWAWEWFQKNISINNKEKDSVEGKPRSDLNIEINQDDVEDVKFTEIDEDEEEKD